MKFNLIKKAAVLVVFFAAALISSGCRQPGDDVYVTKDIRKSSDVLLIMYLSGDANNGNNFFPSLQQAEDALTVIRNEDDSPKEGYKSVNVVALFDGADGENDKVKTDSETRLLELGRGFHNQTEDGTNSGLYSDSKTDWSLSSNTIDLSSTVNWLVENERQEVNMGSYKTLKNFLTWVNSHYTADQLIITFGDHGNGPGVEIESTSKKWAARAIVFDSDKNGNTDYCLRTCDIVDALSAAGYTGESTPDLIIEDLCLGASIEEAYGLKEATSYFLASPNATWSNSMGYYHFVTNLAKNKTLETICKEEVDNFAQKWPYYSESSGPNTFTFADLTDLSSLENIKSNLNAFSNVVMADTEKYKELIQYIREDSKDNSNHIIYKGAYVSLKDFGWLFEAISKDYSNYEELIPYCKEILQSLSKVILYSFASTKYYTNHENGTYSTMDMDEFKTLYTGTYAAGNWYGLSVSISQQNFFRDCDYNVIQYENCSLFGQSNTWGELLRYEYDNQSGL